jgi:hypothetical protein
MGIKADWTIGKYEDGVLNIELQPPTAIGGWLINWSLYKRYGSPSSGIAIRSAASGYNGVSGVTVTDSGAGRFSVTFWGSDTSGLDAGNYVHSAVRMDSGFRTNIVDGFVSLEASVGN